MNVAFVSSHTYTQIEEIIPIFNAGRLVGYAEALLQMILPRLPRRFHKLVGVLTPYDCCVTPLCLTTIG